MWALLEFTPPEVLYHLLKQLIGSPMDKKAMLDSQDAPLHGHGTSTTLADMLSTQHDANDDNQVQRALQILPHIEEPLSQLQSLEDPAFEKAVSHRMQEYIDIYQHSHWYDGLYFSVNKVLDTVQMGYTQESYDHYKQNVELGKALSSIEMHHPDLLTSTTTSTSSGAEAANTLKWEEVFGQGSGYFCHNSINADNASHALLLMTQQSEMHVIPELIQGLI